VAEQEHDLVQTATVSARGRVRGSSVQTHFGNQLVDEDDHTNGADEAAQERSAEDGIEETKSAESSCEDDSAREASDHACDLSVLLASSVRVVS